MFPQQNAYRQYYDLSGFWDFRFDPEDQGQASGWTDGFEGGQPVILSEFGADALPGHHAQPPEMFSEEYQAEFIACYIQLMESKPYVVGEHVWNLVDFKTGQVVFRMNSFYYKDVFTRDCRPKLAAHRIKEL